MQEKNFCTACADKMVQWYPAVYISTEKKVFNGCDRCLATDWLTVYIENLAVEKLTDAIDRAMDAEKENI